MLGTVPLSALAGGPQCARLAGGGDSCTAAEGHKCSGSSALCLIASSESRVEWSANVHYLCSLGITHRPVIAWSRGHQQGSPSACTRVAPAPGSKALPLLEGVRSAPARPRHTSFRPGHAPLCPGNAPSLCSTALTISPSPPSWVLATVVPQKDPVHLSACLISMDTTEHSLRHLNSQSSRAPQEANRKQPDRALGPRRSIGGGQGSWVTQTLGFQQRPLRRRCSFYCVHPGEGGV